MTHFVFFSLLQDGPEGVDQLDYAQYAKALVGVLCGPHSATPVTVGLYAFWGQGKSFLMK